MQIEQLGYWFLDPEWWISATQGIVGALVGFTGLYFGLQFTKKHEVDLQREARDADQKRREHDQSIERISDVIQGCLSLEPSRFDRELTGFNALIRLLVIFFAHEVTRRPNLANWAIDQATELSKRIRGGDLQVPFNHSVAMIGDLAAWIDYTDDVNSQLVSKEQIDFHWKEIEDEVDPSLAVTWDDLKSSDVEVQKETQRRLYLWDL